MDWSALWENTIFEFWRLLKAPILVPELWWILTPLIVTTLIMTLYFGKYIKEKLGWNTALSNSVVLLFISIDLLRTIVHYTNPPSLDELFGRPITFLAIFAVMIEGFLMARAAFNHAVPKRLMFFIASPVPVNVQAYVLTAVVYTQYHPSLYTLIAALLLFAIIFLVLKILQELEHVRLGYHFSKQRKNKLRRNLRS